ncbi:NADPH-dependent oxidoreductase [Pseudoclavibacter sp. CFCC 13796]|uniref:nitroreductase family protein n=1 Tax=Pseudoclavibacter sp. CFCC 13796 TaxID=2615179 RepID=UPI0013015265|nr:nitroreductase family protein [Pseudoclavibacter sp. CFCC 13796]KAB1660630.1 NADPH-dependent oxidoreductase [Pseudoclavibacter sp. CFCC 13796]
MSEAADATTSQNPDLHQPTRDELVEALRVRFGGDGAPAFDAVNPTILRQLQHRSVRRFSDRDVTDDELRAILTAAQAASTSSNQHSWSVIVVRDQARKEQLKPLIGNQPFIDKAPVLLFWIADLHRSAVLAERAEQPFVGGALLEATLVAFIDAALAAQNAAVAAESLGLGITYIGGARNHPEETAAALALPSHAAVAFGMTLGWPSPTDRAKIRPRPLPEVVVHQEQYDADVLPGLDAYAERINGFFADYGREFDWESYITEHFADYADFYGRERLRDALRNLGLPSN